MILADTSVWIDHFRNRDASLSALLNQGLIVVHPFVSGELACGNLRQYAEIMSLLQALPQAIKVADEEIFFFIEKNAFQGSGLGLIDVHLLASARLGDYLVWTRDRSLQASAKRLDLAFEPTTE